MCHELIMTTYALQRRKKLLRGVGGSFLRHLYILKSSQIFNYWLVFFYGTTEDQGSCTKSIPFMLSSELALNCAAPTTPWHTSVSCVGAWSVEVMQHSTHSILVQVYYSFTRSRRKWDQQQREAEIKSWERLTLDSIWALGPKHPWSWIQQCRTQLHNSTNTLKLGIFLLQISVLTYKLKPGVSDRPKMWNCLSQDREEGNSGDFCIFGWKAGIVGIWKWSSGLNCYLLYFVPQARPPPP